MNKALYVDSVSSVAGAFIGTRLLLPILKVLLVWQSVAARADCGCGWRYVPVGYVLLTAGAIVPPYATAGALIFVGVLMIRAWRALTGMILPNRCLRLLHGDDALYFLDHRRDCTRLYVYCIMKVCTGRWRDLNLCVVGSQLCLH